ncbi:hypothetical protein BCAR13_330006 [Paraburkholderia caribensis]|nr:hypothetical protein BCAR13_330006 [Paraburkholderia caribensis]
MKKIAQRLARRGFKRLNSGVLVTAIMFVSNVLSRKVIKACGRCATSDSQSLNMGSFLIFLAWQH